MEEIFKFIKKHVYLALSIVFTVIICSVLVMSFYANKELQRNGRQQFYEKFVGVAADYEVDSSFDKNLVIGLAKNLEGMSYAERCQKIEQMGSTLYESYKLFGVADKTGKVHTSHTDDYYIGDRDFFRTLRDGQDDVISSDSNNYTPDGRCKVLYTLAKLKDAAGNFDGVVFLAEEANKDLDILDLTFFEKEVPAFLVRPDGQVVSYRGQDFNTDNLLKFLKEYSPDCKNAVEKMQKDFAIDARGMVVCDYADGATITYYPVESVGREKMDFLVFIMPDELLFSGINTAMSRMNKYLALGVLVIMMLVGYVLYIYLQMNERIENLSYVSSVTGGPNIYALQKVLADEKWEDFYLVAMVLDGYYKTLRHRNTHQMQSVMAKLWRNIDHEFVNENVKVAYLHSHYFILAVRKDREETETLLSAITKSLIKFFQVNSVGVLFPHFGLTHIENGAQDFLGDMGRIISIVVSYDFSHADTNYVFTDDKKDVFNLEKDSIVSFYEKAVNSHAFKLDFQPKRDREGKLVGSKIVSTWKMEDGRVIKAEDFLGPLSRQGLLPRLDMMNFRLVCKQLREWKEAGKKIVPVSVFLSEASLFQEEVVKDYKLLTEVAGIDPKYIQLEFSESSLSNVENMEDLLAQFREAGFKIVLGDFVNGISGLVKIRKDLVDYLSLGRVMEWADSKNGYIVCKGLVDMAKQIGLKIILTHINSPERRNRVDSMEFDEVVGEAVGAPLAPAEFAKLLEQGELL